jgi:hypothetical protein
MGGFFKGLGVVVLGVVIAVFASAALPPVGSIWGFCALAALTAIGSFKPLPKLGMGRRGLNAAILIFIAIPFILGSVGRLGMEQEEARLAALKDDPAAYLAALKERDDARWLEELAELDPAEHKAEMQRRADAKAKADADEAERLRLEREDAAEQARAKQCGEDNTMMAYAMSQQFVTDQLRAPATAEFPWADEARVKPLGDCRFRVAAHVDSQNGFGALIRTHYTAILIFTPESEMWEVEALDFAE